MLSAMKQDSGAADRVIEQVLSQQGDVIARAQLLRAGWTEATLRYRTRAGGMWALILPGIYVRGNGVLADGQRETAAALFAGPGSVVTGKAAARQYGLRVPATDAVDVLVPRSAKRQSIGFVRVHRTMRMPDRPSVRAGIRWAPVARAVADATRAEMGVREARALVAGAVQQRACTISALGTELAAGPKRGSGVLRTVLEEVAAGVRSAAEGDLRKLIRHNKLPQPMYNAQLLIGQDFLAQPDAWWPEAGVAGEVDSREWHLLPADWERTMARHAAMTAKGILVVHVTPQQLKTQPDRVAADLRAAIEAGLRRPKLEIRAIAQA